MPARRSLAARALSVGTAVLHARRRADRRFLRAASDAPARAQGREREAHSCAWAPARLCSRARARGRAEHDPRPPRAFQGGGGRTSPFSIWDWRQYHAAGLPDLHLIQKALQVLLVLAALVLPFYPRKKSPLQLAALTAALLLGFQLVQTYWFYTYIPWFFPFLAFAVLAPAELTAQAARERAPLLVGKPSSIGAI